MATENNNQGKINHIKWNYLTSNEVDQIKEQIKKIAVEDGYMPKDADDVKVEPLLGEFLLRNHDNIKNLPKASNDPRGRRETLEDLRANIRKEESLLHAKKVTNTQFRNNLQFQFEPKELNAIKKALKNAGLPKNQVEKRLKDALFAFGEEIYNAIGSGDSPLSPGKPVAKEEFSDETIPLSEKRKEYIDNLTSKIIERLHLPQKDKGMPWYTNLYNIIRSIVSRVLDTRLKRSSSKQVDGKDPLENIGPGDSYYAEVKGGRYNISSVVRADSGESGAASEVGHQDDGIEFENLHSALEDAQTGDKGAASESLYDTYAAVMDRANQAKQANQQKGHKLPRGGAAKAAKAAEDRHEDAEPGYGGAAGGPPQLPRGPRG